MSSDISQARATGRLSFGDRPRDTLLLNGRPLAELFPAPAVEGQPLELVFPFDLNIDEHQVLVRERLERMAGWVPVLIAEGDGDLYGTVYSAWVEERDGLIIWSRLADGLDGEFGPVDLAPLAFDRAEYLEFVREAAGRIAAANLVGRLNYTRDKIDLAGELQKYGPEAGLHFLARLIFDQARAKWAWEKDRPLRLRKIISTILIACAVSLLIAFLVVGADGLYFPAIGIGLGALIGIPLFEFMNLLFTCPFRPPVFVTRSGFRVGRKRAPIPWGFFQGFAGASDEEPEGYPAPSEGRIRVGFTGRIRVKPIQGGPQEPDFLIVKAWLAALIKKRV